MRILLHYVPHQSTAVVLDHDDDRSLIDAEVVDVEPAQIGIDGSVLRRAAVSRVERIGKSVLPVERRTIAALHLLHRGNGDLRSECDR